MVQYKMEFMWRSEVCCMNILSIGNSFSQDAQRYLHQIAKSDGISLTAVNLYIGGCPLSRHYRNMLSEEKAYELEVNGQRTGFFVSLKEALLNRNWDVITLQQASHESIEYNNYQPYSKELAAYVRRLCPKAKIVVHQTWAYDQNSPRLYDELGYRHHTEMFADVKNAYEHMAEDIQAQFVIPSGELLQELLAAGIETVHRDGYHTSYGLGRYALGLLWYAFLTGNSVADNQFSDFDEPISSVEIACVKACVESVAGAYQKSNQ